MTSVNTLCVETSRYHATDHQKKVFAADKITVVADGTTQDMGSGEDVFGPFVRWFAGFNKVRDEECLKPAKGA